VGKKVAYRHALRSRVASVDADTQASSREMSAITYRDWEPASSTAAMTSPVDSVAAMDVASDTMTYAMMSQALYKNIGTGTDGWIFNKRAEKTDS
jgi:hypothetical protein